MKTLILRMSSMLKDRPLTLFIFYLSLIIKLKQKRERKYLRLKTFTMNKNNKSYYTITIIGDYINHLRQCHITEKFNYECLITILFLNFVL